MDTRLERMDKDPINNSRPAVHDYSVTIPKEKAKLVIEKNSVRRWLYIIGGTVSIALALLGIIVPGLPVTPLALLAAILYAKSSENYITGC